MFKIVSTGWNCAQFIKQTLQSIEDQSCDDWQVMISYEGDDNGADIIRDWWIAHEESHHYDFLINSGPYMYDVKSRWRATSFMNPNDDDIIVTLDLDGDTFAHRDVLAHLLDYYADDTLLTYGSYLPIPPDPGNAQAAEFPPEVVAARSYRAHGRMLVNHLRTMKGRIFNNIPVEQFQFAEGPKKGQWYTKGNDVESMFCGLELAGPRFKLIPEILMYYNSVNPNSAWRICQDEISECVEDFLRRPPLPVLPIT